MSEVVRGCAEAANDYDEVRPQSGLQKGSDNALLVIPNGGVAVNSDAQSGELAAEPRCVRINEVPEENLGSDGHYLSVLHRAPITSAASPGCTGLVRRARSGA